MARPVRRILIDCSYIDFSKQPTGIPRVVLKYIEVGYDWGRNAGVEVIPVVPTVDGVFLYRPVPGRNAPAELVRRARIEPGEDPRSGLERTAVATAGYVQRLLHHIFHLVASLVPVTALLEAAKALDLMLARWGEGVVRAARARGSGTYRIEPQPGDVLFCPAYWHDVDPDIYKAVRAKGARIVVLVHDLLPIAFDRFYNSPWCYQFRDNARAAFGYADAFTCVSDYTRDTLIEFGLREKQPIPPVMTTYNGFEPLADRDALEAIQAEPGKLQLGGKGVEEVFAGPVQPFIMVGSIEPKKGHIPVIRAFEQIWRAGHPRNLVIVGRRGWLEQAVVDAITGSPYFGKKLFWLTGLDDFDLAGAYVRSHALVFSSVGEGFGIPMIEASFYGRPTIVYDSPIAREVLGGAGLFFRTAEEFVDRIVELEDPARYEAACEVASKVSWPSWAEYTPLVFDALATGAAQDPIRLPPRVERPLALIRMHPSAQLAASKGVVPSEVRAEQEGVEVRAAAGLVRPSPGTA